MRAVYYNGPSDSRKSIKNFTKPDPTPSPMRPALPRDPGLDRLLADPELGSTPKAIAVALVRNWAWYKDRCWPSDRSIAARIGRSVGHVQRCLRALESRGWIARERAPDLPTGRRIWLVWRTTESPPGPSPTPAPAAAPQAADDAPRPAAETRPTPAPSPPQPVAETRVPSPPSTPLPPAAARPAPQPATNRPDRKTGLGVAELTQVVAQTGDPILAAELARRLAPPPRPETPPETWATDDLLARLPGRHDLTFAAIGCLL